MGFLDPFRQLKLLLWKNFVIRKRAKLRALIELLWPTFLFIILVLVRLRELTVNEIQCHYTERPLPSSGILPFLRGYLCELNNSCSNITRQPYYSNLDTITLTNLSTNILNFTIQPEVVSDVNTLTAFGQEVLDKRAEASAYTKTIPLQDALIDGSANFQDALQSLNLTPVFINSTWSAIILRSNPNFNFLYSNYSRNYSEPLNDISGDFSTVPQPLFNFFYGEDLDRLDFLRDFNFVDNSDWLRAQMCDSNQNYLLRGTNEESLSNFLCSNLSDTQLADLFVLISRQLDISAVKLKVFNKVYGGDFGFLLDAVKAARAFNRLTNEIIRSNLLPTNNLTDIFDSLNNLKLSEIICPGSLLSIFDFIEFATNQNAIKVDARSIRDTESSFRNNQSNSTTTSLIGTLNSFKDYSSEDCPIKDKIKELPINTTANSCFCQNIFTLLRARTESRFIFNILKSMLFGKILYSPNTPAYNDLIKKVNSTFETLDAVGKALTQVSLIVNELNTRVEEDPDTFKTLIEDYNQLAPQLSNFTLPTFSYEQISTQLASLAEILEFVNNLFGCVELDKFIGFPDEESAVGFGDRLNGADSGLGFWACLIFQNPQVDNSTLPDIVNYKIRMDASTTHNTIYAQDILYSYDYGNCQSCNKYFLYGFIYLQDILERTVVEAKTNEPQTFGITEQQQPFPCHINDKFIKAINRTLPLFMVLAWIYSVSMLVKDIVYEKEKRLKEFMRVMGLSNIIHWAAWFITSFAVMFVVIFVLTMILKFGRVLQYINFLILLLFLTCFIIATICQCFLFSVFFNRANLASVVAGILYFVLYLPYTFLVKYEEVLGLGAKVVASLSSTVAFSYGSQLIGIYELQAVGIQWDNFYKTPLSDGLSMNAVCLLLLMDAVIYLILAWYIESVWPGEYGVGRPWYFPLSPYFWCGDSMTENKEKYGKDSVPRDTNVVKKLYSKYFHDKKKKVILEDEALEEKRQQERPNEKYFEQMDTKNKEAGIEIKKLHKVYSRGNNHALKGLEVKFYKDEITAFLGHNGAGKSTTMHLLTGLYKPTAGTAFIDGLELRRDLSKIRKSLGFVPQHNVLFPDMTVEEHLLFYSRLKGLDSKASKDELTKLLSDTGLTFKRAELSKNLSGGMQRKLSVAIAFSGGSKTVILDEPSAGVDPNGRRSIWDLLFKFRAGRTIIVSTHHMDEADVLGDRIAIISNGKLIAHGTGFFLKNNFGRGYYLTISKKKSDTFDADAEINSRGSKGSVESSDSGYMNSTTTESSMEEDEIEYQQRLKEKKALDSLVSEQDTQLHAFITQRIKKAILVENIGSEMTYSISNNPEYTKDYEGFFRELEQNMDRFGIDTVGISDTTLEEIFIKIASESKNNQFKKTPFTLCGLELGAFFRRLKCWKDPEPVRKLTSEESEKYSQLTNVKITNRFNLNAKQLSALLLKRLHRTKRNTKGFFAEIVLPVVFVVLALLVASLTPNLIPRPALELHPWYYNEPNQVFVSKSSSLQYETNTFNVSADTVTTQIRSREQANIAEINRIVDTFYSRGSLGTRCLGDYQIKISESGEDVHRAGGSILECEAFDFEQIHNYTVPDQSFVNDLLSTNYSLSKESPMCDCSSGFPVCPASAGGDINYRPLAKLRTKDLLYDLTSRNMSDWLIKTRFSDQFFKKRFGGFEFIETNGDVEAALSGLQTTLSSFLDLVNATGAGDNVVDKLVAKQAVRVWYNIKGYTASVSYLNVINNAILRSKLPANVSSRHGIVAYNHPMKLTKTQFTDSILTRVYLDLAVSIFIIFALSLIPASFLVFLLGERETNIKQLQFVSGVKPYVYWISNFIWDLINYIVPAVLCIFVFLAFQVESYISPENFPCLVALLLLYGWAIIPLMYPLNYLFKTASTAFVVSSSLNIFIGIISVMSTSILDQLAVEDPDLGEISDILTPIFIVLFPHFCLGRGLLDMAILYTQARAEREFGIDSQYNPFEFNNIGRNLLALIVQGFVFFTLNMLIEYRFFIRFSPKSVNNLDLPEGGKEDDDVLNESKRILASSAGSAKHPRDIITGEVTSDQDYIKLTNLTKIFKKFKSKYTLKNFKRKEHVAVNNLSLGINRGECFGLIGVNGAGKTTTFKMITGEIPITAGDVTINGYSISKQKEKVHRSIGYCPQFDALMPLLTAREHLKFFARLRGIPEVHVKRVCEWAMDKVGLNIFADRLSNDLSGGNKRKLSTAIALIGNPSVICLDEPTSGMDAKARRLLWNDIINLIKENRIVILTSHSMEECEALCSRLVIMVNGRFKCLGSPQHLKSKFGSGFRLSVKLNDVQDRDRLREFMAQSFPTSYIQETHENLYEFILPFKDTKLSEIFGKLEKNRQSLNLKDYSVSQSSLDQIFVNFAKEQNEEGGSESNQQDPETTNGLVGQLKEKFDRTKKALNQRNKVHRGETEIDVANVKVDAFSDVNEQETRV